MTAPRLVVVIPCYNEQEALPITAKRLVELTDDMIAKSIIAPESVSDAKRTARHEGDPPPSDLCRAAERLIKNGGRFCVIYPAPRAFEMMRAMYENRLAPKRIRTVHGVAGRPPKFVLMDAVKGGGEGLHWLEALVLRNEDGSFTEEWHRIYG